MQISFFGCLLAASATAFTLSEIENDSENLILAQLALNYDSSEDTMLAQAEEIISDDNVPIYLPQDDNEKGAQWLGRDGSLKSLFNMPPPNCCNFYNKVNFEGVMKQLCYDLEKMKAETMPEQF